MNSTVISIWGPTGSPGRTTVAINLAAELAAQGKKVALVDADTYGGAIATYLAIPGESSAIATLCRLAEAQSLAVEAVATEAHQVLCGQNTLSVFSGISRPERWVEISSSRMKQTIDFLQTQFEIVVLDLGFNLEADEEITSDLFAPRRNAATLSALNSSKLIVEVVSNNALSLARFIRAHAKLNEEYPDIEKLTVINFASRSAFQSDAAKSLQRFAGMRNIFHIRSDSQTIESSQQKGLPLVQVAPKSSVRKDFQTLSGYLSSFQSVGSGNLQSQ